MTAWIRKCHNLRSLKIRWTPNADASDNRPVTPISGSHSQQKSDAPGPAVARGRHVAAAFGLSLTLLTLLLLGACVGRNVPPPDPMARFRPAMKPEFQSDLDTLGPVPVYAIEVEVAPDNAELRGSARVHVPNASKEPWTDVVFRLYPMLEQYGGYMQIQGIAVDGQPTTFIYISDNNAVQVDLTTPLAPGDAVDVEIAWSLLIPTWPDVATVYQLFGNSQDMTSLPLFYPSLAVFEDGPAPGTGSWWLETGSVRGDAAFNVAALFEVTATLASEQVPVTSGTLITSSAASPTQTRYVWVTGPSREFVLHMSPRFQSATQEAYGTRVTSYWMPGEEAAGRAALRDAIGALRIFSDRYGEYPFEDMRVAPAPISFRGMEYPQVSLLGIQLYSTYRDNLEILTAHEVAHQWWYQLVHNDPVNAPWLDEAIAEFSMKLYMDSLRGEDAADFLLYQRWQIPVEGIQADELDVAINQPVLNFASGRQYETIVYGKGALFYDAMRDRLGDRRFNRFWQDFLAAHRYGIVTEQDWLAAIKALDDPELVRLYERWVNGPRLSPTPVPSPTPAEGD